MAIRDLIPWKRERTPARQPVVRREEEQDPFRAMERMVDDFFGGHSLATWGREWSGFDPKVDVVETDSEIKVAAELPGLDAQDVNVTVSRNVLSIKGEKKQEREETGKNWYRMERSFGSFERSVSLPEGIDTEQADAAFDKGVLTITFPKRAEGTPAKIDIKTQ